MSSARARTPINDFAVPEARPCVPVSGLSRPGAYAIGIDDRRMLMAAQSGTTDAESRRAFVEARLEDLPFPAAVFDVVVAVML